MRIMERLLFKMYFGIANMVEHIGGLDNVAMNLESIVTAFI